MLQTASAYDCNRLSTNCLCIVLPCTFLGTTDHLFTGHRSPVGRDDRICLPFLLFVSAMFPLLMFPFSLTRYCPPARIRPPYEATGTQQVSARSGADQNLGRRVRSARVVAFEMWGGSGGRRKPAGSPDLDQRRAGSGRADLDQIG